MHAGIVTELQIDGTGARRFARLARYLHGRVLADVRPRTRDLLRDLGRTLGRLDRALTGFVPPAGRPSDFVWDLRNAGRVMERGVGVLRGEQRAHVERILAHFRRDVEPRLLLSDFLRHELGLTGTHVGCEHGVCGACTVLFDGEPVRSCILLAVQADGHEVTTVEALSPDPGRLHPLQQAFVVEFRREPP